MFRIDIRIAANQQKIISVFENDLFGLPYPYRDRLWSRLHCRRGLEKVCDRFSDVSLFKMVEHLVFARAKDPAEDLDKLNRVKSIFNNGNF